MKYLIKKIFMLCITLVLVSVITFGIFQILPGDPIRAMLGITASPEQVEMVRHELGYDKPAAARYIDWAAGLFKGDLGTSLKYQKPVSEILKARIQPTMCLGIGSLLLTLILGIPIGVTLALYHKKGWSTVCTIICQIGTSIPCFWLGMMLIFILSVKMGLLPAGGYTFAEDDIKGWLIHLILPCISLAIGGIAVVVRYLKNGMLDQMKMDFVRTAYSKGLSDSRVVYVHVLRNAMIPVITIIGMLVAEILAGSIVVETVFQIPGLGALMLTSITSRDFILLQSLTMYIAIIVVVINTLVDVLYAVIDPRIRIK